MTSTNHDVSIAVCILLSNRQLQLDVIHKGTLLNQISFEATYSVALQASLKNGIMSCCEFKITISSLTFWHVYNRAK